MATTSLPRTASRGGSFLWKRAHGRCLLTRGLDGRSKTHGRTAEEFVRNEVVPSSLTSNNISRPVGAIAEEGGEIGLLGGGVPRSTAEGARQSIERAACGKFVAYASFGVSTGPLWDRNAPIVFFGTENKRRNIFRCSPREKLAAYCLSEPQAGSTRRTRARARAFTGRALVYPERAKDVDHQRRIRDVYIVFAKVDGEKFSCFIVERAFSGFQPRGRKKDGLKGSSTTALFSRIARCPRKIYARRWPRAHRRVQHLERGEIQPWRLLHRGSQAVARNRLEITKERTAFGKPIGNFGLIRAKLAEMAIRIFAVESMIYRSAG